MLPSNRRLERLRKRFSMYRMHHKACLMMHQNYSATSECCFVKPQIRVNATAFANDPITRPLSIVKRRQKKLPSGIVSNQRSSSLKRNKNLGQPSELLNQRRIPSEQMPTSNALSILSNPSFLLQQTDDFVDSLESLLNFGNGLTVLPVLRDIEVLDYFERIAN